jgi:hypothetical protein
MLAVVTSYISMTLVLFISETMKRNLKNNKPLAVAKIQLQIGEIQLTLTDSNNVLVAFTWYVQCDFGNF